MSTTSRAVSASLSRDNGLLAEVVEEITNRLQSGEAVDIEAFAAKHPVCAEELRKLGPALQALAAWSGSGGRTLVPTGPIEGQLGDYRILREVGRGGMGVVYEAVQISLGRRVALKVLPFAATIDPKHLQRFHNEARAAATLHHPNIVPVFAVGQERGVHFYAMQFIEGRTLAEWVAEQRSASTPRPAGPQEKTAPAAAAPTDPAPPDASHYRRVAEWGVQAAEALEHAHSLGIVHRDVKPGNIMLDDRGVAWVTDFGLARTATSDLTMSGDVLGTLRYMSPEQALARHGLVDHRTDVYSLGATCYELLTGRRAVDGEDREEVLRQVAFEEPPPPRRLNREVPAELETVVLKAIQKEPADRYATAKELADDLRRFLDGRPVQARRPTAARRLERWLFRHRRSVAVAAAGLLVAAVALSGAALWAWGEKENARREQARAEANLDRALEAVDRMLAHVADRRLRYEPRMEKVRRALLEEALGLCRDILADNPESLRARVRAGSAHRRVAQVRHFLGEDDQAVVAFGQAVEVLNRVVESSPKDALARLELARAYRGLGGAANRAGRHDEAQRRFLEAIALLEAPATPPTPECRKDLADANNRLGELHRAREQLGPAREAYTRAIDLLRAVVRENPEDAKALSELGGALNNLAAAQPDLDASPRAVALIEEATAHQRAALRLRPDDRTSQGYLRNHLENLAVCQHALGKEAEATQAIREVVQICEEFVRQFPAVPSYRDDLYAGYQNWGNFLKRSEPAEAERHYRRALELGEALVKDFPKVPAYRRDLAAGYHNLLLLLELVPGRDGDVAKAAERAIALYESLRELAPTSRYQLATCYLSRDVTRRAAGRTDEAATARRQAIGQLEKALAARRGYGDAWRLLALARHRDGSWKESLAAIAELRRLNAVQSSDLFRAAVDHWRLGDRGEARQCFVEGEALLKKSAGGSAADRVAREEAAKLLGMPTSQKP